MSIKLFVYGSLKSRQRNHYILQGMGAHYIGPHMTLPEYSMFEVTPHYPGVIAEGYTRILGEVYEVPSLEPLDIFEGYCVNNIKDSLFIRKEIITDYGETWMYLYNQSINRSDKQLDGIW